eukprot:149323-Pyramimonas_sp.AAC.1
MGSLQQTTANSNVVLINLLPRESCCDSRSEARGSPQGCEASLKGLGGRARSPPALWTGSQKRAIDQVSQVGPARTPATRPELANQIHINTELSLVKSPQAG